jgi:hypothetical protein
MRKNMNIPRKKEKQEQPVIISRITRPTTWIEPTKKHFLDIVWYELEMVWVMDGMHWH